MARRRCEVYVHLVWTTWQRLPLLRDGVREAALDAVAAKCQHLGAHPLAVGGMPDHVHVAARIAPTVSVSTLCGQMKGYSSYQVQRRISPVTAFRWQDGYAAFSFAADDLGAVVRYIEDQPHHHASLSTLDTLEPVDDTGP